MLQLILEPIFAIVFIGIGYVFGFVPVWFGSLGTIEPGPVDRINDRSYYRSKGMRWWHATYLDDGTRYLPAEAVALVGWILIGSIVGIVWLVMKIV